MGKLLVVVDMQNDFISGSLGSKEAEKIVERVCKKMETFEGRIWFTKDTHGVDYLNTQEGRNLPVVHCIKGSDGWQLERRIQQVKDCMCTDGIVFEKNTFGSVELAQEVKKAFEQYEIEELHFCGVCTDICVISNAMLCKAYVPELPIIVDASCCAGVTPESHKNALEAMKMCQIKIENEEAGN